MKIWDDFIYVYEGGYVMCVVCVWGGQEDHSREQPVDGEVEESRNKGSPPHKDLLQKRDAPAKRRKSLIGL